MSRRLRAVRLLIRLVGPLTLVLVVLRLEDKGALSSSLKQAAWLPLVGALLLNLPVIHLKVLRWRELLAERGYSYPLDRSYAAVLSSLYLGMLTPGRVGDALRIQYVRCEIDTPYTEGLAATLMDRFCDLYVLAAVAALGMVHFAAVLRGELAFATWIAVAIAMLAPVLLLAKGPAELFGRLLRRFTERWHASLDGLLTSLRALTRKGLVFAIPLTVGAFALNYAQGWLLSRAIGIDLSYVDVAALLSATSLLGLMPISISGIGVRELFLALVFPALGLQPAQGVAFGLLVFACINLATVLIGFVAWQLSPPPLEVRELKVRDDVA